MLKELFNSLFYDYEYEGNTYRIRPGGGDEGKNILGLPPVLFAVLAFLVLMLFSIALYKK